MKKVIVVVAAIIAGLMMSVTIIHASCISSTEKTARKVITSQNNEIFGFKPSKITFTYNKSHTKITTATVRFSEADYQSSKLLQTDNAFYEDYDKTGFKKCRIKLSFYYLGGYSLTKKIKTRYTDLCDTILKDLYEVDTSEDEASSGNSFLANTHKKHHASVSNLEPLTASQGKKLIQHYDELNALTGEKRYDRLMDMGLLSNQYQLDDTEDITGDNRTVANTVKKIVHLDKLPKKATIYLLNEKQTVKVDNGEISVHGPRSSFNQNATLRSLVKHKHLYIKTTSPGVSGLDFGQTDVFDFSGGHKINYFNGPSKWSIKGGILKMGSEDNESTSELTEVYKDGPNTYRGTVKTLSDGHDISQVIISTK